MHSELIEAFNHANELSKLMHSLLGELGFQHPPGSEQNTGVAPAPAQIPDQIAVTIRGIHRELADCHACLHSLRAQLVA